MKILFRTGFFLVALLSNFTFAQNPDYTQLDPEPYNPETEPDIDLFISSWKDHKPRITYGSLVEHDIFTRSAGDPLNPHEKGAVLIYLNRFTHGSLEAGASTTPTKLSSEQIVFFFDSGKGIIEAGKTAEVYDGVGVIMPPDITFIIKNTSDEPLTMYLIAEPYPEGFRLNTDMQVVDENTTPVSTSDAHWIGIVKPLFATNDGLGTLESIITCSFSPMTFFHPHSHVEGCEEVWITIDDEIYVFIGKQLRLQSPGTAYMIPPDGNTPHANFNTSDKLIKMFYFARYGDHEVRK